ncbi:hypothetical protein [Leclercia sp.]|uniref:hypothetical protein n=1 Tax=Leclercia sp. TaxID=1898428 RepID=UPI0028A0D4CC|nr:hypothetical protein [Leclercia sp.]
MKMNLIEMEGFLHGNGIPGDLRVNESNASYLVRKFSELEAKCAALAAENAVLKSAVQTHSESIHFCELCGKDDPCSTDDVCMVLSETPSTDAFLAEVRAQGVEMVIAYHRERADALHHVDRNNAIRHSMAALDASDVAAQLRQESAQ